MVVAALTACAKGSRPLASVTYEPLETLVVLPVEVAGRPAGWWILDSGFEYTVIDRAATEGLGLRPRATSAAAAPGGTVDVGWVDSVALRAAGQGYIADSIAVIPLSGIGSVVGHPISGILGHDFLERFVVRLDYAAHRLTLYEPAGFRPIEPARAVPVWIEAGEPFILGMVSVAGRAHPAKLKLDTGSLDCVGFNGSYVAQTRLVPDDHPRIPAVGAAIGGRVEAYVTRLDSLVVGGYAISEPVVGYSADLARVGDAGTIGGGCLSRFTVTFDYTRRRIMLTPNTRLREPSEFDMSGLFCVGADSGLRRVVAIAVDPGSPAHAAGIQAGDTLVRIDGTDADGLGLARVRALLRRPDTTYALTLRRKGRELTVSLRTRRRI
jgi:membrane-associated protease RseP (regulator of RpoE activity)